MEALAQRLDAALRVTPAACRGPVTAGRCTTAARSSLSTARAATLSSSASLAASASSLRAVPRSTGPASAVPRVIAPRALADIDLGEADDLGVEGAALGRKYPPFAAFRIHGTGRRKTAVARVGLIEGDGNMVVNGMPLSDYFQDQALLIQAVKLPLSSLGYSGKYDVVVKTHGGGLSAQAQAMMLGIARALVKVNEANKPPLKAQGMLTRDSRAVERKKYGLKKARKAPQFSKR